jgi:hypothetical protein
MRVRRLITNGFWQAGSGLLLLHLATPNLVAQERNPRLTVFGGASFLRAQRIFLVDRGAFRTLGFRRGRGHLEAAIEVVLYLTR